MKNPMPRITIATLRAALPAGASLGEDEWPGGGCVYVNAPEWKAWSATGTNSIVAEYYNLPEWDQTRPRIIASMIDDMVAGLEDATADTIHAMGWER